MGLEMREKCETCPQTLAADGAAFICSNECTYCPACASRLGNVCRNCAGETVTRPRRVARPRAPK